jgi:hypothetical protein
MAFVLAAREAAAYATQTMPTIADEHIPPGGYHHMADRARLYHGQLTAMAVACDVLIGGASWAEVGARAGLNADGARHRWGHVVDQIERGDTRITWAPNSPGITVAAPTLHLPLDRGELDAIAAGLDHDPGNSRDRGPFIPGIPDTGNDAARRPLPEPDPHAARAMETVITTASIMLRSPVAASLLRPLLERVSRQRVPRLSDRTNASPTPTNEACWGPVSQGLPD